MEIYKPHTGICIQGVCESCQGWHMMKFWILIKSNKFKVLLADRYAVCFAIWHRTRVINCSINYQW